MQGLCCLKFCGFCAFFLKHPVQWEFRYREENVKNADNLQLCVSVPWLGGGKQPVDSAPLLQNCFHCTALQLHAGDAKPTFTDQGKEEFLCTRERCECGCSVMRPKLS